MVARNRPYIGQYYDPASALSYLNARYYNSTQGQFLSQDPIFKGNPANQSLVNPQSENSYSYANDNPITNSDPAGLFAAVAGYTVTAGGIVVSGGVQFDLDHLNYYYSEGKGVGAADAITAGITTANLDDDLSVTNSVYATGGDFLGFELNKGVSVYPYSKGKPPQLVQSAQVGFATGLSVGARTEISGPVYKSSSGGSGSSKASNSHVSSNSNKSSSSNSTLSSIQKAINSIKKQLDKIQKAINKSKN